MRRGAERQAEKERRTGEEERKEGRGGQEERRNSLMLMLCAVIG